MLFSTILPVIRRFAASLPLILLKLKRLSRTSDPARILPRGERALSEHHRSPEAELLAQVAFRVEPCAW
jgi:hypothetical protein